MRKYLLGIVALAIASLAFFAFKTPDKKNARENTTSTESKEVATVNPFSTAMFPYISGHLDSASSYGTTPIPLNDCPNIGTKRCSATFDLDGSGNRIGAPKEPVRVKP